MHTRQFIFCELLPFVCFQTFLHLEQNNILLTQNLARSIWDSSAAKIIENDRRLILNYFTSRSNLLPLDYFSKVPSQIKNENGLIIPILMHSLIFSLQKKPRCAFDQWLPAHHLSTNEKRRCVINVLSNQTSRCICKCIRIRE